MYGQLLEHHLNLPLLPNCGEKVLKRIKSSCTQDLRVCLIGFTPQCNDCTKKVKIFCDFLHTTTATDIELKYASQILSFLYFVFSIKA